MNYWGALTISLVLATASPANPQISRQNNSVQLAANAPGATWTQKINAAIAFLPANGGTVDARTLCHTRALSIANADIALGNDKKPVHLKLGACTYPLGNHSILYFSNTEVSGEGAKTEVAFVGSGAALRYGGSLQRSGVYNVYLHDFTVIGNGDAGSIGVDMTYTLESTLERLDVRNVDNAWKLGGTSTCSCYNQIIRVSAFGNSRGGWLDKTANQNQIFGGAVRANTTNGIGLDISGAASNQIYSLDVESSSKYSIQLQRNVYNANGNTIVNPYLEAAGPILLTNGATENSIIGAGGLFERGTIVDRSGNTTNYFHQTGGGGATHGIWPYYEAVQDAIIFGIDPFENSIAKLSNPGVYGTSQLTWTTDGPASQYGVFGHAPLEVGEAIAHSGAKLAGLTTTSQVPDPAAPTVTPEGTQGGSEYRYYVVCHDRNGGVTLPSPAGLTEKGSATLSQRNYNRVTWKPIDGCWSWDVLRGDTRSALAMQQRVELTRGETLHTFKDVGQSTRPYTPPSRNTTGDVTVAGMNVSEGIGWPLPGKVVNGASFYCPNCDPPEYPPTNCTSHGSKTGSWVHGLNNTWMCVP